MLWQLQLSHYNEKVRWALDHKQIAHIRRSLLPGLHAVKARRLTGDTSTTPVLTLDGRSVGDSTRIIALLEQRWPQPPLYPQDETLRRRALQLEDFFDEQLGPHVRRAAYHDLLGHPDIVVPLFAHGQGRPQQTLLRVAFPLLRVAMRRKLNINAEAAQSSRESMLVAMDRLEGEIGPSGFLVGSSFTVADLTAAALFYPVVRPVEYPYPTVTELPPSAREFLDSLARRSGGQWVAEMYRRHRSSSAEARCA